MPPEPPGRNGEDRAAAAPSRNMVPVSDVYFDTDSQHYMRYLGHPRWQPMTEQEVRAHLRSILRGQIPADVRAS